MPKEDPLLGRAQYSQAKFNSKLQGQPHMIVNNGLCSSRCQGHKGIRQLDTETKVGTYVSWRQKLTPPNAHTRRQTCQIRGLVL